MDPRVDLRHKILEALEMARGDVGDWLVMMEIAADDLARAGYLGPAHRLSRACDIAASGGHDDWLAMIESVADELA